MLSSSWFICNRPVLTPMASHTDTYSCPLVSHMNAKVSVKDAQGFQLTYLISEVGQYLTRTAIMLVYWLILALWLYF